LFTLVAAVSLVLCVGISAAWALSYRGRDEVEFGGLAWGRWGDCVIFTAYRGELKVYYQFGTPPHHGGFTNGRWNGIGREPFGGFLRAPAWVVVPLLGCAPAVWVARARRRRIVASRRLRGLCTECGYDVRATPDRCPECGAVPGPPAEADG